MKGFFLKQSILLNFKFIEINFFFFLTYSQSGPSFIIYLFSIHKAICRPSDHSVVRPRTEIRTRDGTREDLVAGTLTTRPPYLTSKYLLQLDRHSYRYPLQLGRNSYKYYSQLGRHSYKYPLQRVGTLTNILYNWVGTLTNILHNWVGTLTNILSN